MIELRNQTRGTWVDSLILGETQDEVIRVVSRYFKMYPWTLYRTTGGEVYMVNSTQFEATISRYRTPPIETLLKENLWDAN